MVWDTCGFLVCQYMKVPVLSYNIGVVTLQISVPDVSR